MNSFIFSILLPLSIAGSILTILVLLLRPLQKRISGRLQKAVVLAAAVLFVIPVGMIFQNMSQNISIQPKPASQTETITEAGTEQQTAAEPQTEPQTTQPNAAVNEPAQTLEQAVQQTPIAAPVYNMGQQIATAIPDSQATATATGLSWPVIVYFAGAAVFIIMNMIRYIVFHSKLRRSSQAVKCEQKIEIYKDIANELRIKRLPRIMQSDRISAPFITGVLRPTLYLPTDELNDTKFAFAFRHELIHYKHADLFVKMVLLAVSAVHWFNPFSHILRYEYAQICEIHCDEALIRSLPERQRMHYASALMQFATTRYPYAVAGMATPKEKIKARIADVIRPRKNLWYKTGVILTTFVLIMGMGMLMSCGLFGLGETQPLESVWVKQVEDGQDAILVIDNDWMRVFYVDIDEEITAKEITEEYIIALLDGVVAEYYSYNVGEETLTFADIDTDITEEYNMNIKRDKLTLDSDNEKLSFIGEYKYVAPFDGVATVLNRVVSICAGHENSLAVKADGSLWVWGSNEYYSLGIPGKTMAMTPILLMDNVVHAYLDGFYSMAIKTDGTLWGWGTKSDDNHNYIILSDVPKKIMDDVSSASVGDTFDLAIKIDGSLWAWGWNLYGQLGDGTNENREEPVKIMENVVAVDAGSYSSAAIKSDGSLWTWGYNMDGQLGDGTQKSKSVPEKIMDDVKAVDMALNQTLAVKTDGSLWAWGCETFGALGNGESGDFFVNDDGWLEYGELSRINSPIKIMDDVATIKTDGNASFAIKNDGTLWGWGLDSWYGQFGIVEPSDIPEAIIATPIKIMHGVVAVSCTYNSHAFAIKEDGSVWAWGYNGDGEFGNGTMVSSRIPIEIFNDIEE